MKATRWGMRGLSLAPTAVQRRQLTAALVTLLLAVTVTLPSASSQESGAAWTIQVETIGPNPALSGAETVYRLSLGCAAVAAPSCDNGVVTILGEE